MGRLQLGEEEVVEVVEGVAAAGTRAEGAVGEAAGEVAAEDGPLLCLASRVWCLPRRRLLLWARWGTAY